MLIQLNSYKPNALVTPLAPATATGSTSEGEDNINLVAPLAGYRYNDNTLKVVIPDEAGQTPRVTVVGKVVTFYTGTSDGQAAQAPIITSGDNATIEWSDAGTVGNGKTIAFYLPAYSITDPFGQPMITPSFSLECVEVDAGIAVSVATTAGTQATLTLTEDAGGLGVVVISQVEAYAGAWANAKFKAQILLHAETNVPTSATITLVGGVYCITVYLAVDPQGVAETDIADTDVADAINAALLATVLPNEENLSVYFTAEATSTDKTFTSLHPWTIMGSGGNNHAGVTPVSDDTNNTAALLKTAIELLVNYRVIDDGTGYITAETPTAVFADGGVGFDCTSTTTQLVEMLTAMPEVMLKFIPSCDVEETMLVAAEGVLSGGVSGEIMKAGDAVFDESYIYLALKDCTETDSSGIIKIAYTPLVSEGT